MQYYQGEELHTVFWRLVHLLGWENMPTIFGEANKSGLVGSVLSVCTTDYRMDNIVPDLFSGRVSTHPSSPTVVSVSRLLQGL